MDLPRWKKSLMPGAACAQVFVAGVTSSIGSDLAEKLLGEDHDVIGVAYPVNSPTGTLNVNCIFPDTRLTVVALPKVQVPALYRHGEHLHLHTNVKSRHHESPWDSIVRARCRLRLTAYEA
jgi:nucleoside-diphosphate-sugar epimerase